jgi:5,10-methylene-tetrahydrofolate dehydrogenase/methenyl tetrahydrofolate cyclohydrolase
MSEYIKEGAIVIDVGTTRVEGKLKGDVKFNEAFQKAGLDYSCARGCWPYDYCYVI